MENGGRSVMTIGIPRTPGLCAGVSDMPEQVRSAAPSMEEGQDISSWMMFSVNGNEANIFDCAHDGIGINNCNHGGFLKTRVLAVSNTR